MDILIEYYNQRMLSDLIRELRDKRRDTSRDRRNLKSELRQSRVTLHQVARREKAREREREREGGGGL